MPARGNAPGILPKYSHPPWRGGRFLRPFRAHNNRWIPVPRALPWA